MFDVGEDEGCCVPIPLFPKFPEDWLTEYDDGLLTDVVCCKDDPKAAWTAAWLEYDDPDPDPGGEPDTADAAAAADKAAEFEKWSM